MSFRPTVGGGMTNFVLLCNVPQGAASRGPVLSSRPFIKKFTKHLLNQLSYLLSLICKNVVPSTM